MTTVRPVDVVTEFYRLVVQRDPAAVSELVMTHFRQDAHISWPDSLPYGGTLTGRRRLAAALGAAASADAPVGPVDVHVIRLLTDGSGVVVELGFGWRGSADAQPVSARALEWWAFDDDDAVISIDAFYHDTAGLIGSGGHERPLRPAAPDRSR